MAHDFAKQSVVCYTLCRRCRENSICHQILLHAIREIENRPQRAFGYLETVSDIVKNFTQFKSMCDIIRIEEIVCFRVVFRIVGNPILGRALGGYPRSDFVISFVLPHLRDDARKIESIERR